MDIDLRDADWRAIAPDMTSGDFAIGGTLAGGACNDLGDLTTTTYVASGQSGSGSVATVIENPAAAGQPDQTATFTYDGAAQKAKSNGEA